MTTESQLNKAISDMLFDLLSQAGFPFSIAGAAGKLVIAATTTKETWEQTTARIANEITSSLVEVARREERNQHDSVMESGLLDFQSMISKARITPTLLVDIDLDSEKLSKHLMTFLPKGPVSSRRSHFVSRLSVEVSNGLIDFAIQMPYIQGLALKKLLQRK
jgi:hypothetical protein